MTEREREEARRKIDGVVEMVRAASERATLYFPVAPERRPLRCALGREIQQGDEYGNHD